MLFALIFCVCNEYKNIIEFFDDDDDNLIAFVNYVENHYLDYTNKIIY